MIIVVCDEWRNRRHECELRLIIIKRNDSNCNYDVSIERDNVMDVNLNARPNGAIWSAVMTKESQPQTATEKMKLSRMAFVSFKRDRYISSRILSHDLVFFFQ